jgi:hypothetical protein
MSQSLRSLATPDRPATPAPPTGTAGDVGERFAAHVGVRLLGPDADSPCGTATATLPESSSWCDDSGTAAVPTGALLALVDATARAAASTALGDRGPRATLRTTATGVHYRSPASGAVTATATVPCEGELAHRADEQGVLRFSVAVELVDGAGDRVATGTVQWLARLD